MLVQSETAPRDSGTPGTRQARTVAPPPDAADAAKDGPAEAATGFCGTLGAFVLCEDFDEGSYSAHGWTTTVSYQGGSLSLVSSPRSAPYALQAQTNATTGSAFSAQIVHSVTLPPNFSTLRFGFDISFPTRISAVWPAVAALLNDTGFQAAFYNNGNSDGGVAQVYSDVTNPEGGAAVPLTGLVDETSDWATYEFIFTRSGATFTGQAKLNGTSFSAPVAVAALPGSSTQVTIGVWSNTPSGENSFQYDNVYVIAQ